MDILYTSLSNFEQQRLSNNMIPPEQSNSFHNFDNGVINLFTERATVDNYRFDIYTYSGIIETGDDLFFISGDIDDISMPYRDLTIISDTSLLINNSLTISKGALNVYGTLEILSGGQFIVRDKANVIFHPGSKLIVNKSTKLFADSECMFLIDGEVSIDLSVVDSILNNPNITVDNSAIIDVDGIYNSDRMYSLTDYKLELVSAVINLYSQGEHSYDGGRFGYVWKAGSPSTNSYVIELVLLYGVGVLGDFRLSALGIPESVTNDMNYVSDITVSSGTILYISTSYSDSTYISPEMYIGIDVGNSSRAGECNVYGNMIINGSSSKLLLDRGGKLVIHEGATVELQNGSSIELTNASGIEVLTIDGTLIIENIEQISTFEADNISVGENGKVVILNIDTGSENIILSTPINIADYDIYRLFSKFANNLEIHIGNNTGIILDVYYEHYTRDMNDWFCSYRIEKAIHLGIFKWDGGFIILNQDVIPWVNSSTTLKDVSDIFNAYGSDGYEKLQDLVNRLRYAGSGNIVFKCIYPSGQHELVLNMESLDMISTFYNPNLNGYSLTTNDSGTLFISNMVTGSNDSDIISNNAKMMQIDSTNNIIINLD